MSIASIRAAACGWGLALLALPVPAQVTATPDPVGDALRYLLPLGALGIAAYRDDMEGVKQMALSLVVAQGTTTVLKHAVNSPRPDGTGQGFPSGHTSAAFTSAGFMHERYGLGQAVPFYVLATVTAWERVHHDHHFTKDVIGGAAIGLGSSFSFTSPLAPQDAVAVRIRKDGLRISYSHPW
ncbi:hypothetical protein GCM10028796_18790 [Ramlibacter monticola]|uniref:Phosphatase PAP2 family protein n=1 Tax=Ramlibacter monticola TaxID=1926872 RepID=A0A936Z1U0_9BURK|nr:phosphatase PAP2 family protein [Ramlibacter monticola]